jgi:anti-anti-sigma factor
MTGTLTYDINWQPGPTRLELATDWRDFDLAVISIAGEIDATNTRNLLDYTLGKVLLCRRLILDLSAVAFFASDGYWTLQTLRSRCALADVELSVVPGSYVARVLRICEQADQDAL